LLAGPWFAGFARRAASAIHYTRLVMSKRVQFFLIGLVCFLIGLLLAPHLPFAQAQESKVKPPIWLHGLEVKSRKAGEQDFTKDTKKYGIEVFKDDNNGNLIYVSETGSIAVVPGK
jgi:hypothetical protein